MVEKKTISDLTVEERTKIFKEENKKKESLQEAYKEQMQNAYSLLGSNSLRNYDLGKKGAEAGKYSYMDFMQTPYALEQKKKLFDSQMQEYNELGIADMPNITDQQLNYNITKMATIAMNQMSVNNLEKIVSEAVPELNFKSNTLLNKYSDFEKKVEKILIETGKEYKPTKEETSIIEQAIELKQIMISAYKDSAALKTLQAHYYDDYKGYLNSLKEKYPVKEEKKEESKDKKEETKK